MSKATPITKFFPTTRPANVERPTQSDESTPEVTVTAARPPEFNDQERAQYDNIVSAMRFDEDSEEEDDIDYMELVEEGTLAVAPPAPIPSTTVRCPDNSFKYLLYF